MMKRPIFNRRLLWSVPFTKTWQNVFMTSLQDIVDFIEMSSLNLCPKLKLRVILIMKTASGDE